MDVSMSSDFVNSELCTVSLSNSVLAEVEDGELIEETNVVDYTEEEKKILRAKRFGGPVEGISKPKVQDPKLQKLYKRMNVDNNTRLEALHLHGTHNMKTEDIFALFSDHTPASIEWLSDKTCNAVWLDEESCANALINCSTRIRGQSNEESDSEEEEECINLEDLRCTLPPGGIWRRKHATPLAPNLFVRFALYSDRRGSRPIHLHNDIPGKNFVFLDEGDELSKKFRPITGNPWSDLAREWSHYERRSAAKKQDERLPVRDARELISKIPKILDPKIGSVTGGKKLTSFDNYFNEFDDNDEPVRFKSKDKNLIGRKMHADIEEKKILSKKLKMNYPQSPSSIDLRQRLSKKRSHQVSDNSFSVEEFYDMKHCRHKRMKSKMPEDTWISHESEESENEEEILHSSGSEDLRKKLKKHNDLKHDKIQKKGSTVLTQNTKKFIPDTPLQIEIDNDIYFERINRGNN